MNSNTKLYRNCLNMLLVAVLFSVMSCKKSERYSFNECLRLKKGDTIYVSYTGDIQKAEILRNDTIKRILELKRLPVFKEIKSYEDVMFKNSY